MLFISTHIPIGINKTHILNYPYRSYVIAAKLNEKSTLPSANVWCIDNPFLAISTHNIFEKNPDYLMVAGNNHKVAQPKNKNHDEHYQFIEEYISKNFSIDSFEYKWSAQHYKPADHLPYIGVLNSKSKNTYIATGYAPDGLTFGTMAGNIISDIILKKPNSAAKIYRSNRFTFFASALRFIKENLNVFFHYVWGYLKKEDDGVENLKPNQAKIIDGDKEKLAVYCDKHDNLYVISAVCPHMKCIVKWNDAEKTWDCPCHGSRFHVDGSVIEGPAVSALPKRPFNLSSKL